jgi:transposase InsO family protein
MKYAHFVALKHPYTTSSVAKLFIDQIYRLHVMPTSIISDRDRVFTSRFWQELFGLAKVQLRMGSAYHPQSDGQTERVNQCMEMFLRCFVSACPSKWRSWLALAEFWYNSSFHLAIGLSPFEALYGYSPRHFGIAVTDSCSVASLDEWLHNRQVMTELIWLHLNRANVRMKN